MTNGFYVRSTVNVRSTGLKTLSISSRLAALPQFQNPRIAARGHGARTEIGSDQNRVFVEIADLRFGLGELEPILYEALCPEIKLAHDHRIAAAAREIDQTVR